MKWICDELPPLNLWNFPNMNKENIQWYSGWVLGASYPNSNNAPPPPTMTKNTTDLVVNDLRQREVMGYNKYNKYLNVNTDEPMLQHLYEELLDACMYIRTLIEQKEHNK